jgi:hypothetical protein
MSRKQGTVRYEVVEIDVELGVLADEIGHYLRNPPIRGRWRVERAEVWGCPIFWLSHERMGDLGSIELRQASGGKATLALYDAARDMAETPEMHKNRHVRLWQVFQLLANHIDPSWIRWGQNEGPGNDASVMEAGDKESEARPWLQIPDKGTDRVFVRLWWQGFSGEKIADRLTMKRGSVYSKACDLRKRYGIKIVPIRRGSRD